MHDDRFSAAALPFPIWRVRKPVIAAVNGHAIRVGLRIALQCDIRIFAADAKFEVVQVRRGMAGDGFSHWTLPRLAGMSAAAEILLSGRIYDGHQMRSFGICSTVLPNDEVLAASQDLANDMAQHVAPLSAAYSKRFLWDSWALTAEQVERRETEDHHLLMGEHDAREGVAAFLQRRVPQWQGRVSSLDPWI